MGWEVQNANDIKTNQPNFDLIANKNDRLIRIQVKAKGDKEKATFGAVWVPGKPSFNKVESDEKADFLVMVRFTKDDPEDNECFVFSIQEAENEVEWFAKEWIKVNPLKDHSKVGDIHTFVAHRIRNGTKFKFNTRAHWEPYSERWEIIN